MPLDILVNLTSAFVTFEITSSSNPKLPALSIVATTTSLVVSSAKGIIA